jgi:hypothetical protein
VLPPSIRIDGAEGVRSADIENVHALHSGISTFPRHTG